MFNVIIFDLDGTLSNSFEGIAKSVQYALSKKGIKEDNLDNLQHFVGPPLKSEFMRSYGFNEEEAAEMVSLYRERYIPIGLYETSIYDGCKDVLEQLKKMGKFVAIATSKPQGLAEEVLRYLEIDKYFDIIMGADLIGPKQTKSDVLKSLFEEIPNKNLDEYVMIGDTCFDIDGANNCGIKSVGVSYGFGDKEEMLEHGALTVVDRAIDLLDVIEEKNDEK